MQATPHIFTAFALTLLASACTDSAARFDEFAARLPDAAPVVPQPDAEALDTLPDVTGTFLLGLAATIKPDKPFQFLAETTLHDRQIDITLTGLDVSTRAPVDGEPLVATNVPVDDTGGFEAQFVGDIPGAADPVVPGTPLTVDVTLSGRIGDEDGYCGTVAGGASKPSQIDITGSTFAAQRVTAEQISGSMPPVVSACAP